MLIDYHYLQKLTTKSPTNATVVGEREFFEASLWRVQSGCYRRELLQCSNGDYKIPKQNVESEMYQKSFHRIVQARQLITVKTRV